MIGIRVDANNIIATGHLMRCIAIAQQIQELGREVLFITSDTYGEEILRNNGMSYISLELDWEKKMEEVEKLIHQIHLHKIHTLVVDSYLITLEYMAALKPYTKLVYIDDLNQEKLKVDILVNYARYASMQNYIYEKNTIYLLGAQYTPLRKEFVGETITIKDTVTDVLITTGGTDNLNLIPEILEYIVDKDEWKLINIHVIVGRFFNSIEQLRKIQQENLNIILHENVGNMAVIMRQCDMAVSAGGTTLAELCSCGVPTICLAVADNQLPGIKAYEQDGIMISVGDVRGMNNRVEIIIQKMNELIGIKSLRESLSKKAQYSIDGLGAKRIANTIIAL